MSKNQQDVLFPFMRREVKFMMVEEQDQGDPKLEEKLGEPELEPGPVTSTQETYSLLDD